jgi:purine-binding chemotaxis protein CheW
MSETRKYLTFTLGEELFALDIASVREIQDVTEITRIPKTPEFMRGVVNLRGNAVPVMDLRQKFGMERTERTINTRIVILEIRRGEGISLIGSLADSVKEVFEMEAEAVDPPPRMGTSVRADFIQGIGKQNGKFVLILDIDKVFTERELDEARAAEDAAGATA